MEKVGKDGWIVCFDHCLSAKTSVRGHTFVADEQQHGDADKVEDTKIWIGCEDAIPQPQCHCERQLASEDQSDPAAGN